VHGCADIYFLHLLISALTDPCWWKQAT